MNSLLQIALTTFLISFSGAASPGPVLTITLAESAKRGAIAGPLIVLGHAILEIPVVVAVTMGAAGFLKTPKALKITASLGAITLFVLAYLTAKEAQSGVKLDQNTETTGNWRALPIKGILTSLSNPYWFLWWATIGLAYLQMALRYNIWGAAIFYSAHIMADLVWYSFVSAGTAKAKRFIAGKGYKLLLYACSLMLAFFGLYFARVALS